MQVIKSTLVFAAAYPEAYQALSEPYRNDDCLEYRITEKQITCRPKEGQELILGEWICLYEDGMWVEV